MGGGQGGVWGSRGWLGFKAWWGVGGGVKGVMGCRGGWGVVGSSGSRGEG